jgi:hypothetical protein
MPGMIFFTNYAGSDPVANGIALMTVLIILFILYLFRNLIFRQ